MESPKDGHVSGLKHKLTECCASRVGKVPRVNVEHGPSFHSCVRSSCCCRMRPNPGDTCFNFLNSGLPRRIMSYTRGSWLDFPETVTQALIEGFKEKKSAIKVSMADQPHLFDFLSMVLINLTTRKQQSVSWIDDSDKCYFPTFFFDEEADDPHKSDFGSRPHKLEVGGFRESSSSQTEVIKQVIVENGDPVAQQPSTTGSLRTKIEILERDSESFLFVQRLFLSGMGSLAMPNNIVAIHRYAPKDVSGQRRLEAFERQIRSIEEDRGNANVQYGWYGPKRLEMVGILFHGFGRCGKPTEGGAYGTGLYLTPDNRSFASMNHCDVDEKGIQHIVLCRVILGNAEQVQLSSKQYFPSNEDYDCGVDDLLSPKCYVVWATHLSSYIHPEYVVSVKLSPDVQEYLSGMKDVRFNMVPSKVVQDFSTHHPVGYELMKGPTSPWMSFTMLFAAIQNSIPTFANELLFCHYEEMRAKVITRDEFIKKMRLIVGDKLLISALTRLKQNPSSWYDDNYAAPRVEPDDTISWAMEPDGSAARPLEPNGATSRVQNQR